MLCPECQQPQVIVEFEGVELDVCLDGHGTWFDDQELRLLFHTIDVPDELHALESRLEAVDDQRFGPRRPCPRCDAKMQHMRATDGEDPVIIDRCPHGHGLWFDDGELDQVVVANLGEGHPALTRIRSHLSAFEQGSGASSAQETD